MEEQISNTLLSTLNAEYKDEKTRNEKIVELAQKGIPPTNVMANEDGKKTQSLVVPGAVITYKDKEIATLLLKGNKMASPQEVLNQSYEGVEYQLASAIKTLTASQKKKIGIFVNYHAGTRGRLCGAPRVAE